MNQGDETNSQTIKEAKEEDVKTVAIEDQSTKSKTAELKKDEEKEEDDHRSLSDNYSRSENSSVREDRINAKRDEKYEYFMTDEYETSDIHDMRYYIKTI